MSSIPEADTRPQHAAVWRSMATDAETAKFIELEATAAAVATEASAALADADIAGGRLIQRGFTTFEDRRYILGEVFAAVYHR